MDIIDGVMPFPGNTGRKVDLLAETYARLMQRHLGRRPKDDNARGGFQEQRVREALQDPAVQEWNVRSIARFLHCSKSMVAKVRKELQDARDAANGSSAAENSTK